MLAARLAFVALLAVSACAAPARSPGPALARGSAHPVVASRAPESAPASSPVEVDVEPAPPPAPAGALCVVRGTGRPEPSRCGSSLTVSDARSGGRAIAQVTVGGFPIAWGFFADGARAWVHATTGGVTVSGFAAHTTEQFTIRGELEAVPGHVWLFDETPVLVKQGVDGRGAMISVQGDLDGVADMPLEVACEVLGYDPLPRPPAGIGRASRSPRRGPIAVAKGRSLSLRTGPRDAPFVTLKGGGDSLPVSLEVREVLGDWTRVRLETQRVRLDGWVPERDIQRNRLSASVGRGRLSCGTSDSSPPTEGRMRLADDTILSVGPPGRIEPAPSLVVAKGTEVLVASRLDGLAEIRLLGPIAAPAGAAFYVAESALIASPGD